MNADGTHPQRLTHNNVYEGYPSWSPDGSRIAFASETKWRSSGACHRTDDSRCHTVNRKTKKDEKVRGGSLAPDWSPDGTENRLREVS